MSRAFRLTSLSAPATLKSFVHARSWTSSNKRKAHPHDMTRVRLCFHDRCFDGTASAALFYRFYKEKFDAGADFAFTGMTHRASQPWEPGLFDGDENVIVDFKYSNSPRVTWWFDHHQSAFLSPADADHFRAHPGPRMFYQPEYKSCTKLIADVSRQKFQFDTKPLEELIRWGDIIDGAQYPTPQAAVELAEPATQLGARGNGHRVALVGGADVLGFGRVEDAVDERRQV